MELIIIIALAIGAYLVWTTFMRKQETPADLVVVDQVAYKVEPPAVIPVAGLMVETSPTALMPLGTEAVVSLQAAHDRVVASGQPDDSKGLDVAIATQAAKAPRTPRAPKAKTPVKPKAKTAAKPAARTAAKKAVAAKPRAKRAV
jgi:hypothetical protein